jgi:hypothetical protein
MGCETAFVADTDREAALFQQRLKSMVDLAAPLQGLPEATGAVGCDHELLEVRPLPVGMDAAIEDVHVRHWQTGGPWPSQILVKVQAAGIGGCAGHRQ